MQIHRVLCTGLIVASSTFCHAASAQSVIYSNMSVDDPLQYGANETWVISSFRATGARFVSLAATDLILGSVVAPMSTVCLYVDTVCEPPTPGTTMQISLNVFADSDNKPGALLAQSTALSVSTVGALYSFSFASGTILESGSAYWINGSTSSPSNLGAGWARNLQGSIGVGVWLNGSYDTSFEGPEVALKVLSPIPEPAQWAFFAIGLLAVLMRLRSRARAQHSAN
jgi:hypothetical protein